MFPGVVELGRLTIIDGDNTKNCRLNGKNRNAEQFNQSDNKKCVFLLTTCAGGIELN